MHKILGLVSEERGREERRYSNNGLRENHTVLRANKEYAFDKTQSSTSIHYQYSTNWNQREFPQPDTGTKNKI